MLLKKNWNVDGKNLLDKVHACLAAFLALLIWPDACLDLTDVSLLEHYHAETALSDATTDREWQ